MIAGDRLATWPAIGRLGCLGKPPQSERPVAGFAELTTDIGNDFLVSIQAVSQVYLIEPLCRSAVARKVVDRIIY